MALRFPARVKAQTSTTGTGTYTLSEPGQAGYRTPTRAVTDGDLADGDTVGYIVIDTTVTNGPNLLEISSGVWDNTAKTLTRATVYQPNATPISWGAGTRDVLVIDNPVLFLLLAGGTMTGILNILISGSIITPAAETSLVVQRSAAVGTEVGVSIISGTSGKSRVNLGDTADEDAGGIRYDNATNTLYFRTNGADGPRIDSSGVMKDVSDIPFTPLAGGGVTFLPFWQASAPTGWTKDTSQNDKAFRVVSGTGGGTGGSRALSASTVGQTTLVLSQIPSHTHPAKAPFSHFHYFGFDGNIDTAGVGTTSGISTTTGAEGGDGPHDHSLALAYIDLIICSKN